MGKSLFTVSPSSLPKKITDISAGGADIGTTKPNIRVERVDKINTSKPKSNVGKTDTNNVITDRILNKARAKGIDKDTLLKMQHEADLEDLNKEMGKYHKTKSKQLAKGNLDMGVEEVDNSSNVAEEHKNKLMKKYGISSEEFDKKYNEYDEKVRTNVAQNKIKQSEEYAKAHPVLGTVKSIGTNLLSPIEGIANNVSALQTGLDEKLGKDDTRHINPNADFMLHDSVAKAREGAKSNIKANTELGKKVLDKTYDIGTMAGDMLAQQLLTAGTGGTALMGLAQGGNTANDMLKQSLENGNGQLEAGVKGALGGVLGYNMATAGLDSVTKGINANSVLGNIVKGGLTEGAEELTENMLDEGIDRGVSKLMGGNSNRDIAIKEYMANGMTEEEAKKAYTKDRLAENAVSFLGGAGFGGVFGGINGLSNTRANLGKTNNAVFDLLNNKLQYVDINNDKSLDLPNVPKTKAETKVEAPAEASPLEVADENLLYHSGILSKLNKAETRGRMSEPTRGTGYYGTGHYFVDGAHKNELTNDRAYNNQPFSSVDVSKAGNLYRADTNEKASDLHNFSQNYTRYITGKMDDTERIDNLYESYSKLFPDAPRTKEEFVNELNNYRESEKGVNLDTREDSIFTQFMKDRGYNGVDTRGTNAADTRYGTVIYDLPEDSILQSNVTDGELKNGKMNTLVREDGKPLFDTSEDERIQKIIDGQNKEKEILSEMRNNYDASVVRGLEDNLDELTDAREKRNDALNYYKRIIEDKDFAEKELNKEIKDLKDLFGEMWDEESEAEIRDNFLKTAQGNVDEMVADIADLERQINDINAQLETEYTKLNEAKAKARETVEGRYNTPTETTPVEATNGTEAPENFLNQNNEADYDKQVGNGDERNRGFYESVDLPEDFKSELKEKVYRQLKNKDTIKKAEEELASATSIWEAKDKFEKMLNNQEAASVVMGKKLAEEFINAGRPDVAVDIVDNISKSLTRAGQFTQSAYITALRNDPIAVLTSMNKELAKLNEAGRKKFKDKWNDIKLTDEEITELNNAGGDTNALKNVTDSIYSRIAKDYPHTFWEYFYDTAKTFMLFNPRTHLRNVVANAVTMPVRSATDRVKAAMEIGYQLYDKNYKRTSSITGGNKKTKAMAEQVFNEKIKQLLDESGGKYEEDGFSKIQRDSQLWKDNKVWGDTTKKFSQKTSKKSADVFKALDRLTGGYLNKKTGIVDAMNDFAENKVTGSNMENLRQLNYLLLGEIEDTPFVKQNFINSLSNYLSAQKITDIDNIPQDAINMAYDEALKATFKDDNFLTEFLAGLKKSNFNKATKVFDIAMPFTKTPANLAMRGIEYSPMGFVKSFRDMAKVKENNGGKLTNADISRFIGDLSKNVTGSAMIYVGYELAKAGIITGSYSENKNEKNWQKLKGFLPNAFHIGDKYYTYDWAQPSSIPLVIGTAIYEGMKTQEDEEATEWEALTNGAKSLGKGLVNAGDAWFNLSPLQNLSNIMGGGDNATYGDNSITTNMLKTVAEFPQTMIPSVFGATARATDTTVRNTYDNTSYGKTYLNQIQAKIPGLSKELPASYDVWGRERKRGTDEDAMFSQYVNPGTFGYYNKADEDVDKYVESIYNAVKDNEEYKETQVLPRQAGYTVTIDGKDKKLNNKEYSLRQKTLGETQRGLVRAFSKVAEENGLTAEEQAKALNKIYKAANDGTNVKLYGLSSSLGEKEAEKYRAGSKEYVNYIKDYMMAERYDLSYDQYMKKIGEGGIANVKKYAEDKVNVDTINKELGTSMGVDTYETYKDRLPSATDDDIRAVETLKRDYDTSTNMKKLSALANLDVTDAERSRYIRMMSSDDSLDAGYINRGREVLGDDYLYQILLYKAIATKYDGKDNNSLSKAEINSFVNDSFDTQEERDTWRYILTTPKK